MTFVRESTAFQARTRIKRSAYVFFYLVNGHTLDIPRLLQGDIELASIKYVLAASPLRSEEYALTLEELRVLFEIPSDTWVTVAQAVAETQATCQHLAMFAQKGLIVTDAAEPDLIKLRVREETLSAEQWNVYSALYHLMTKWKDVRAFSTPPDEWSEEEVLSHIHRFQGDALTHFVRSFGEPPEPFYQVPNSRSVRELPVIDRSDGIFALLAKRCTTRAFDVSRPMALEYLSLLLRYVYGCHGYTRAAGDYIAIKKTSPSGGGLHPIEVYPLIRNVAGVASGLYHYDIKNHALELIEALGQEEVAELANEFTANQLYPKRAHVLFIMTARFYRNHWKYRRNSRTYGVILMDAAHLSQTLYLVAAELGLGAFVTAAINSVNIEVRLDLDGFREGPIAVCGVGIPAKKRLDPKFHPYVPRETRIEDAGGAQGD